MTTIPEIFGSNVFSRAVMKERLPKKVYAEVVNAMENGGQISMATADVVADAMKNWAVEKGATHYCHWFQPLTGSTAEKHDAFLTLPDEDGHVLTSSPARSSSWANRTPPPSPTAACAPPPMLVATPLGI